MVYVYDIECFWDLFLVVFIDANSDDTKTFLVHKEVDERKELFEFLGTVKGLIGYNNINYDMQLIEYIYRNPDFDVRELRNYSNSIVKSEERLDVQEWKFRIPNLDLYRVAGYDNKNKRTSLKWLEYSMDMENIEDLPTDGDGDNWRSMVINYCINDVLSTKEFYKRLRKEIDLRKSLGKRYNINCINYSNTTLGSEILLKLYCNKTNKFLRDVRSLRSIRDKVDLSEVIFPYIKLNRLKPVLDKFKSITVGSTLKGQLDYSYTYKGFQFDYGVGGIHGSLNNCLIESDNEFTIIDCDVASLYPSIAVKNGLYPEHLGEEFTDVYENDVVKVRLHEKKIKGDKAIIDGFKEVSNSVFGNSNNQYSWLYDIKYFLATTINGQLLLTMLADMLFEIEDLIIIQINTDGITVKIRREYLEKYYEICRSWEELTKLELEFVEYDKMGIKDVNNYFSIYGDKIKCRGAFEYENIPLHKNKSHAIIPRAVVEYFRNGTPVEETIMNHTNIYDFCAGVRAKYADKKGHSWYELRWLEDSEIKKKKLSKTVRYFISKQGKYLFKCYEDGTYAHVEAPLDLGKMKKDWKVTYYNKSFPVNFADIDYSYYIHKAKEMVNQLEGNKQQLKLF